MTKRELATLACKLLGIFFFVSFIGPALTLPYTMWAQINGFMQRGADFPWMLLMILTSSTSILGNFLYLIAGLLLWFKAEKFAARIFSEDSCITTISVSEKLMPMALALAGVILLALIGPHLLVQIFRRIFLENSPQSGFSYTQEMIDLASSIIQVVVGIWLICGTKKIYVFIQAVHGATRD